MYPRIALAGLNASQSPGHDNPVISIQRHHIRDAAQCNKIEIVRQVWWRPIIVLKPVAFAQSCPQRQQNIEYDPDAGQAFAWKFISTLLRIDDCIGIGQYCRRQVVVGNEHFDIQCMGMINADITGDAIIDRND